MSVLNKSKRYPVFRSNLRCYTCFAQGRNLRPLKDINLASLLCPEMFCKASTSSQFKICWECDNMFFKIKRFKATLSKAHELLWVSLSKKGPHDKVRPPEELSSLSETKIEVISIPSDMTVKDPISIDMPIKIERESCMNQVKLERMSPGDDYGEFVLPLTHSDESTDTASETESTNSDDPLSPTENKRPKIEKKYIEIKTPEEIKNTFKTPNNKWNYKTARNLEPAIQTIITPRGLKESVKVTAEVRKVLTKVPGVNTNENGVTRKVIVPVKHVGVVHGPPLAGKVDGSNVVDSVPQIGMYDFYDQDVKCKIMSEPEMLRYRETKVNDKFFKIASYKCEKCIIKFNSQENLDQHINQRHSVSQGSLVCNICEQRFTDNMTLASHHKEHYIVFECVACSFQQQDGAKMSYHVRRLHDVSMFTCRRCRKTFDTFKQLKQHRRTEHPQKVPCSDCEKTFTSRASLVMHQGKCHDVKLTECPVCQKKVKVPSLKAHLKTHDDKPEDAVYCLECGTTYKNKQCYTTHLKTSLKHNTIEQIGIKCELCSKMLVSKTSMKEHIEVEHIAGDYTCDNCQKCFKSKKALLLHIRRVHEWKKYEGKLRVCEYCGKTFREKSTLVQHINSHLGHRPYKCQDCGSTFSYSGALHTHRRLVHKVKKKSDLKKLEEKT